MKNRIDKWLDVSFASSSSLTSQFAQFEKDFKLHIKHNLPPGAKIARWSRGHFEVYGHIERDGKFVYFSVSDVRHWQNAWYNKILIRTAESEADFTGGANQYTSLPKFKDSVDSLL